MAALPMDVLAKAAGREAAAAVFVELHAASCVAFGGAHEVVERVVWLECEVVLCTVGRCDLVLVGEFAVGHWEAELLPDSHLTEDGPDLEGWLACEAEEVTSHTASRFIAVNRMVVFGKRVVLEKRCWC